MYKAFFGFTERPFKLVPSPDFYFLSKSHEEAMAHLSYAVSQGDGFVAITGEVGAGKTTLCRTFLDQLDNTVEVAYILNPGDSALQLIKSICQEFGLSVDGSDMHALINRLNPFLLASRRAGKTVLVLIDEAQHLRQSVLEQLRLLSNLETAHDKLLQIILVGQPELMTALQTHALRQLRQRISLTCRLMPFTLAETRQYISHRINRVVDHLPAPVFTKQAARRIHGYSGGTPRLINIACDRALLVAFGRNQKRISGRVARRAVAELSASRPPVGLLKQWLLAGVAFGLAVVGLVWWGLGKSVEVAWRPGPVASGQRVVQNTLPAPIEAKADPGVTSASAQIAAASSPAPEASVSILSHAQLGELLDRHDDRFTRMAAVGAVLSRWRHDPASATDLTFIKDDGLFFRQAARQAGMRMQRLDQGLDLLEIIDLPAILQLWSPTALHQVYVGWVGRNQDQVTLEVGETRMHTTREVLASFFSGMAYVPWKNFYNYQGVMGVDAPGESVLALKLQLMQMGLGPFAMTEAYDRQTRQAVTRLQQRWGLDSDGFAGPITQMALYGRCGSVDVPRLNLSLPTGADRSK